MQDEIICRYGGEDSVTESNHTGSYDSSAMVSAQRDNCSMKNKKEGGIDYLNHPGRHSKECRKQQPVQCMARKKIKY